MQLEGSVCFNHEARYKAKVWILSTEEIKDLNTFVDAKITTMIECHKRKYFQAAHKFKYLILLESKEDKVAISLDNKPSYSKVRCTSGEEKGSK
eukprot:10679466-Ditylum_brightwellii.AAC.1